MSVLDHVYDSLKQKFSKSFNRSEQTYKSTNSWFLFVSCNVHIQYLKIMNSYQYFLSNKLEINYLLRLQMVLSFFHLRQVRSLIFFCNGLLQLPFFTSKTTMAQSLFYKPRPVFPILAAEHLWSNRGLLSFRDVFAYRFKLIYKFRCRSFVAPTHLPAYRAYQNFLSSSTNFLRALQPNRLSNSKHRILSFLFILLSQLKQFLPSRQFRHFYSPLSFSILCPYTPNSFPSLDYHTRVLCQRFQPHISLSQLCPVNLGRFWLCTSVKVNQWFCSVAFCFLFDWSK